MAQLKNYNPKALVVVRRQSGLSLGGEFYARGEVIDDDCISVRKKLQLYRQNILCHPHEVDKDTPEEKKDVSAVVVSPAEKDADKVDSDDRDKNDSSYLEQLYFGDINPEADNGDDAGEAEKSDKVSDTQEGKGESSEPVAKKRTRLKK